MQRGVTFDLTPSHLLFLFVLYLVHFSGNKCAIEIANNSKEVRRKVAAEQPRYPSLVNAVIISLINCQV